MNGHRPVSSPWLAIGWLSLAAVAIAASTVGTGIQLVFAVAAIGGLGMAHGASDLAMVATRRSLFLAAYLLVLIVVLVWWMTSPVIALPLFLLLSAIHFALEEDAGLGWLGRLLHGGLPIVGPAVTHRNDLGHLLSLVSGNATLSAWLVAGFSVAGSALVVIAAGYGIRFRQPRLLTGIVVLLAFPPLVGFSLAFLVLHALPQNSVRALQLGCPTTMAYFRRIAPLLVAAAGVCAAIVVVMVETGAAGPRTFFAAIAALAVPHMLVTPLFARKPNVVPRG